MGIDIYFFVEYRDTSGKWNKANHYIVPCETCKKVDSHKCYDCYGEGEYDAFSILDGVKPYYLENILSPCDFRWLPSLRRERSSKDEFNRFPDNMSKEMQEFYDEDKEIDFIYHGHGYCTLQELKEYDWDKKIFQPEFDRGIGNYSTEIFNETTPRKLECCNIFHDIFMRYLSEFSEKVGGPENVRILFCYL